MLASLQSEGVYHISFTTNNLIFYNQIKTKTIINLILTFLKKSIKDPSERKQTYLFLMFYSREKQLLVQHQPVFMYLKRKRLQEEEDVPVNYLHN